LVSDEHVSGREQSLEDLGVAKMVIIQGDRALVTVGGQEVGGLRGNKRRPPTACLIAATRSLDLDYVRAEVAKDHGAVRPCQGFRKFYDTYGPKGGRHGRDYSEERQARPLL
jgi:hypothetical protein